jgi:hypothetical protein
MELINPSRKHCAPRTGACAASLLVLLPATAAARRNASLPPSPIDAVDCIGTGTDVECFVDDGVKPILPRSPATVA